MQGLQQIRAGLQPHVDLGVSWIADSQRRHLVEEIVVDVRMNEQALGGDTGLAGILCPAGDGRLDRIVEVGVLKN